MLANFWKKRACQELGKVRGIANPLHNDSARVKLGNFSQERLPEILSTGQHEGRDMQVIMHIADILEIPDISKVYLKDVGHV